MSAFDPFLREVMACPQCKGGLVEHTDRLVCAACSLAFPIVEGIPVLLLDDAVPEVSA